MTQPKFAPVVEASEVREAMKLPTPESWIAHRAADYICDPTAERKPNTGIRGPDQGYALYLGERFVARLHLVGHEEASDVIAGAVAIGLKRASIYGRAPVSGDIELALELYGFLGDATPDQIAARQRLFKGAHHDYWQQRDLADFVPESTLRMLPSVVASRLKADPVSWRSLSGTPA